MTSSFIALPVVSGGGGAGEDTLLRGKYVRTTRFESIGSGTSGTLTIPTASEIVLDDFGGGTDAIVTTITSGRPNVQSAKTADGTIIAVSLDADGDWVLTGTPSAYPVAIVYRVRQTFEDFDSDSSNIMGIPDYESTTTLVQDFASSGTYYVPAGAKWVEVWALGGGGGGGSARKAANGASNVRCGGGGGAAGALTSGRFAASALASPVAVTIGAGGSGGPSTTGNTSNGSDGVPGGTTTFGTYLSAPGGSYGRGGTNLSGAGGTVSLGSVSPWNFLQNAGAAASTTGLGGATPSVSSFLAPNGGASGGGISALDAAGNGANGGAITSLISPAVTTAGGAAGGAAPANAGNGGTSVPFIGGMSVGSGGGSSRASLAGNSGNGGDGGPGAGGGGSGAVVNDVGNSGVGGNGGNGWCVVITYF